MTVQTLTMADTVDACIQAAMRMDDRLTLLTATPDPLESEGTRGIADLPPLARALHKEFGPWRVMRLPHQGEMVMGAAVGAALGGLRVVVDLTALDRLDGLVDELLRHRRSLHTGTAGSGTLPLILRARLAPGPSAVRASAALAARSGLLTVAAPATLTDAHGLMAQALRLATPVLLLEHDSPAEAAAPARAPLPFARARIARPGGDITVLAFSALVAQTVRAADRLAAQEGIDCEVIDPRTLAPFDEAALLGSLARTGRLAVVESGGPCALMDPLVSLAAEKGFSTLIAPIVRIQVPEHTQDTDALAQDLHDLVKGW